MATTLAWVVGACLTVAAASAEDARVTAELAESLVSGVSEHVSKIRGLEFRSAVPVEIIDDDQAREYMIRRVHEFQPPEHLAAAARAFELLGLLPEGTDILEAYLETLREQAGGFYDPGSRAYYLLDDMPAALGPALTAHELTHALEDQHFQLDGRIEAVKLDDDRLFARSAVHEGSAMLVMTVYITEAMKSGELGLQQLQAIAELESAQSDGLQGLPPLLARHLLGPYLLGALFLQQGELTAVLTEGYPRDRVQRAYRETPGPDSSEQILHPEKFWDSEKRDDPETVDLGRAGQALGQGWQQRSAGVLGEISLAVLTGDAELPELGGTSSTWTNTAAAGWGGDRWELWSREGADVVLLLTSWDTDRDAQEFDAAIEGRGWATRREGRRVAVIAGELGAKRLRKLLDKLINDATVSRPTPDS